jgi:hypothetical protein
LGGWFRTVYSGFHVAVLRSEGHHYRHSHNIVPWDASLAATVVKSYFKDKSGTWHLEMLRVDSLRGDQLRSTTYTRYGQDTSVHWRGDVYDDSGRLVGAERGSGLDEGYTYTYRIQKGNIVTLTSLYTGRPFWRHKVDTTLRTLEAQRQSVPLVTDTVGVYNYHYDPKGRLASINAQTFEGQNIREFARTERITQILLPDTVSVLSIDRYGYLMRLTPATRVSLQHVKEVASSSGPYRVAFKAALDDRYRIISVMQEDSNETRTSYFDDNSIRKVWKIWHRFDGDFESVESRQIRKHDKMRRVIKTEWIYRDHDDSEHTYSEVTYEY